MNVPYLLVSETMLLRQVHADLARHEAFREFAYPDPRSKLAKKYKGKDWPWGFVSGRELFARIPGAQEKDGAPWTYGYGFTMGGNPDMRIAKITADRILDQLILAQHQRLKETFYWYNNASFVTKTVLINMAFNLGLKGLLKFVNTLRYIKEKNYTQAAANMEHSLWFKQVKGRAVELTARIRSQSIQPQHLAESSANG